MDRLIFLTAHELQARLASGLTTSTELVSEYLDQIECHNVQGLGLRAVLSVRPRAQALEEARSLDDERAKGHVRGALHGIPILVKDAFVTDESLGMPSTVGSAVFATMKAKQSASLIDRLRQAGLIILGKSNMTEFCGLKSNNTPIGWSALGGQTLSAYRRGDLSDKDQPISGGSSSGSCVGITAGFAPLAIGTETSGSIVYPASLSGLYGLKITPSLTPVDGIFKLSRSFDGIGPIARDPYDLASLTEVLIGSEQPVSYTDAMKQGFEGLSVGVVKSTWGVYESMVKGKWDLPAVIELWEEAVETMKAQECDANYPLEVEDATTALDYQGEGLTSIAYYEFPSLVEEFISNFHESHDIKNLGDIIEWNKKHAHEALPEPYSTQTELIKALEKRLDPEKHQAAVKALSRLAGPDGMDKIMREKKIEIVLAPSDSTLVSYAACAGWPIATVPIGNLEKNGEPYGMFALARHGREDILLRFMAAWHKVFAGAQPPKIPN